MKVLIAENDRDLSRLVEPTFKGEGIAVLLATEGGQALNLIHRERPDFVLLDSMIPAIGGVRLCRRIRMEHDIGETPIIIIGKTGDVSERILALDAGADAYFIKPLDMEELLEKMRTLGRSDPSEKTTRKIKFGPIEMDPARWLVSVSGSPIDLTEKEYRLLQELLEARGRVLSRDALLEHVWRHEKELELNTRTVDVHIGRLRRKLGSIGNHIITVRNVGYRIAISPEWISH